MHSVPAAGIMDEDKGGYDMNEQALLAAIGTMMDEKLETVKAEFSELMDEKLETVKADIAGIKERLAATEKETRELKILMENETNRAVGLVLDGHESLRQIIEGRLVTKDDREQDQIRICALEGITKLHTAQIADLKKKTG